MNAAPIAIAALLPASILAAWLYMHKDAEVEQRLDKRELLHQIETARFDLDYGKRIGDKEAQNEASERLKSLQEKAGQTQKNKLDGREKLRESVDELLLGGDEK